jgi:YesN/AraC family two-component response regulator
VSQQSIRVLIVDDHPMSAGLSATIGPEVDMTVVATASNGVEGLELFRVHQPDITLLDLRMPEMEGVETIEAIRREFPRGKNHRALNLSGRRRHLSRD